MKIRRAWPILISIFTFAACNSYHKVINPNALHPTEQKTLPATSTIDWNLMHTSVLNQCVDCHSGETSPTITTLSETRQDIGEIWNQVSQGSMPPMQESYVPLTKCQLAALKKWIDLGMPETSPNTIAELPECLSDDTNTPIEKMPLNYETLKTKILGPRCVSCHCAGTTCDANTILFEPYQSLVSDPFPKWSAPAATSRVLRSITRTDKFRMPPPTDSIPLTTMEIDFITRWINAGKPEK